MGRPRIAGKGEGDYAVMYETPSDEDNGPPGRVVCFRKTPELAREIATRLNEMLRRTNPHWGGKKYGIYYVRQNKPNLPWLNPPGYRFDEMTVKAQV